MREASDLQVVEVVACVDSLEDGDDAEISFFELDHSHFKLRREFL